MEPDLQEAFYSAASMLGARHFVRASYRDYAGLKGVARVNGSEVIVSVSKGFSCASRDALVGLGMVLFAKLFRKAAPENAYVRAYKEFVSRQSVSSLGDSLRRAHGRKQKTESKGRHHDLIAIAGKVLSEYYDVFDGVSIPSISWGEGASRRRVGFHDEAFDRVVISKALDSPRVPSYVVEYVLYHELLHAKHDVLYQRGKSMRRTVHSRAFKEDEKKFAGLERAEAWLRNCI